MKIKRRTQSGQALITLLVIMIIAITVTTAAVAVLLTSSYAASNYEQGTRAYAIAESGAENGLLRLLRNPFYTGETLSVSGGTAVIQVATGSAPIITSIGTYARTIRKIQVKTVYTNNILSVTSWKEIY